MTLRLHPPSGGLKPIRIWLRIRPIGTHGHTDGKAVGKGLGPFNERSVSIINHDQGGTKSYYEYPNRVFPVDCTQKDVASDVLPGLLDDFWGHTNALIFAYGQTGTGKTHTKFGVKESLAQTEDTGGWGLLPRAVHATLAKIEERRAEGIESVLLLSAVEFYCLQAYDLASKAGKQMCTMQGSQVVGNSYQHCDSPAVLAEFLTRVYGNRNVVATKMNDGSSRSHCAITLTLMTLDTNSNTFRQTSFSIVDLGGAERPNKASDAERINGKTAIIELDTYFRGGCQGQLSIGMQGYLINSELTGLLTAVVSATNEMKAGRPFEYKKGPGMYGGSAIAFLWQALAGEARLDVLICLSQSPQNGWETWFSVAKYRAQLYALKTRLKKVVELPIKQALEEARKDLKEAADAVANQKDTPSAMKYAAFKMGMKVFTEQRLYFMEMLQAKSDSEAANQAGAQGGAKGENFGDDGYINEIAPGDLVEIQGFVSEAGSQRNGLHGHVISYDD